MSEIILHVASLDAFFAHALASARRIDAGDYTPETPRIGFQSIEELWRTMSPERWDLLEKLQHAGPTMPDALAQRLGRDADMVAADVKELSWLGLIESDEEGRLHVPWSKITAEVSIANAA
ncbi:hypothetical protein [Mangrovicella endophytica]|uniref:HVO_A0114 family putative DNA-binding protein n=1 Tax=Mangrovicella endophytica TaxID=2066697 RepID=UPI000C9E20DB|nr:hypothetical protein [Mangrovicella endophytica]